MAEGRTDHPQLGRKWPWQLSITARILAFNVIAVALLAGSLFYIDSYRRDLIAERFQLAKAEVRIAATALSNSEPAQMRARMITIAQQHDLRLRLYDSDRLMIADSFDLADPTFTFVDPNSEPWYQHAARLIDRGMDTLLGAPPIADYIEPENPSADSWPEIAQARGNTSTVIIQQRAPDRTPVINAATPVGDSGSMLLITRNARDITQNVRDARQTLVNIVGAAFLMSVLLSLFLGRTIVQPLRSLVRAAVRVRLGRAREVVVPRLPDRRDEIGLLARAISDMTAALRQRIDAVETFAADVSHELKNPLTSMRSALESLQKVEDTDVRTQLFKIAQQDVERLDRLVTEIADASCIDAQLSRTKFNRVDIHKLVRALTAERESRGVNDGARITISANDKGAMFVEGDAFRLERVMHNLLDNAVSFSPAEGEIEIELAKSEEQISVAISDSGPGIPDEAQEKVFERFHSLRPSEDEFGKHSGLGLAIARTIVEAHFGTLITRPRRDSQTGARFGITLPAWQPLDD